jgi:carboxymethylenebutenolidase
VTIGKPHPQRREIATRKLDVNVKERLGFEDAAGDVLAARAADARLIVLLYAPHIQIGIYQMATTVNFKRPDGQVIQGYLAEPEHAAGAAAIVIIQEWWGVNDQIRGVADRLASAGYIALVPDLYRGKSTVEAEEAHHLMTGLNFGDAASQDIRGAVQFLKTRSSKVGVTGFCMGGALTLLALCMSPEIDAGVVWYGCPPLEYIDATKIRAPLQGHWATQDEFFPIARIDSLQDKLREAGVTFDFHRYLAHHAFANETAVGRGRIPQTQYDPVWSQQAWDRTFSFFGRWLK